MTQDAGRRDRYVTVQQRNETDAVGASGAPVESWTTVDQVYMHKRDTTGRERFAAAQLSARVEVRFEMAYRTTLDPDLVDVPKGFRLVYQGRIFDITSACHLGRQEGIEFLTVAASRIDL